MTTTMTTTKPIKATAAKPKKKTKPSKTKTSSMQKNSSSTSSSSKTDTKMARPYNRYNLYFILERENLILSKGGKPKTSNPTSNTPTGYENIHLQLPPFPPRFQHFGMPNDWCVPGLAKRRPHRKTHGVASFQDLARTIAKSWKVIDEVTSDYCREVEKILKQRHEALKQSNKDARTKVVSNNQAAKNKASASASASGAIKLTKSSKPYTAKAVRQEVARQLARQVVNVKSNTAHQDQVVVNVNDVKQPTQAASSASALPVPSIMSGIDMSYDNIKPYDPRPYQAQAQAQVVVTSQAQAGPPAPVPVTSSNNNNESLSFVRQEDASPPQIQTTQTTTQQHQQQQTRVPPKPNRDGLLWDPIEHGAMFEEFKMSSSSIISPTSNSNTQLLCQPININSSASADNTSTFYAPAASIHATAHHANNTLHQQTYQNHQSRLPQYNAPPVASPSEATSASVSQVQSPFFVGRDNRHNHHNPLIPNVEASATSVQVQSPFFGGDNSLIIPHVVSMANTITTSPQSSSNLVNINNNANADFAPVEFVDDIFDMVDHETTNADFSKFAPVPNNNMNMHSNMALFDIEDCGPVNVSDDDIRRMWYSDF